MNETIEVTFNQLGNYQSLDCLYCGNQAVQQADTQKIGGYSASIRCCANPECMAQAKKSAKDCME